MQATSIMDRVSTVLQVWVVLSTLLKTSSGSYLYEECIDHTGKKFLLLFLENSRNGMESQLFITTPLNIDVTVRIQTPSWVSADNVDITVNVNSTNATVVNLPESLRLKDPVKDQKGILITSSHAIVVYGGNIQENSGDSSIIYPIDALGSDYIDIIFDQTSTSYTSTIGVAALHDNTVVNIDPPGGVSVKFDGAEHTGVDFQIHLNKYETFQIESQDLSGTLLSSNNIISVFTGYTFIQIGSSTTKDYIEMMLPPLSSLSLTYFLINNPLHTKSEYARVVNAYEQTSVSFISASAGNENAVLGTRGSHKDFVVPMTGGATIQADKPVLVAQYSQGRSMGSKGDPRILLAFSEDNFLSEYTFVTPAVMGKKPYVHWMVILCEDNRKNNIFLDGTSLTDLGVSWTSLDSTGFSYTYTSLAFGAHKLTTDVLQTKFSGYVFGYGSTEEYGAEIGRFFQDINETSDGTHGAGSYRVTMFRQILQDSIPSANPFSTQTMDSKLRCHTLCIDDSKCKYTAVKTVHPNVVCHFYDRFSPCTQITSAQGFTFYRKITAT